MELFEETAKQEWQLKLEEEMEQWQNELDADVGMLEKNFAVFKRQYVQDAKKYGRVEESKQTNNNIRVYLKTTEDYMERLKFLCKKYNVKKFQYNRGLYEVSLVKNDAKSIGEIETAINNYPVHTIRLLGTATIGGKLQKIAILSVWMKYGNSYRCSDERIEYRSN